MSMWELLVNGEVIDRMDLKTDKYDEAHTYFRLRKNLNIKSFDNIFKVRKYVQLEKPVGDIKWWKEENTKLDIEKE